MFNWFHRLVSKILGKNTQYTPVAVIRDQMLERRPIPIGRTEFNEFVDRIYSGCCIPGVTKESIAFALADQILHLGPTEDHKEDAFFIHALRKFACNQTADEMRKELRDAAKARLAAEETAKKSQEQTSEVTPKQGVTDDKEILGN